jgi:hypothetical protein
VFEEELLVIEMQSPAHNISSETIKFAVGVCAQDILVSITDRNNKKCFMVNNLCFVYESN